MVIRELRKLFSQYQLLNRQIRMLKNNIHAVLSDNGIDGTKEVDNRLFSPEHGWEALKELDLSSASEISVRSCLELLWKVKEQKEKIRGEILLPGEPLA